MPARAATRPIEAEAPRPEPPKPEPPQYYICVESFVGFHDPEGMHMYNGKQDKTILDLSKPAHREIYEKWGKFFEPIGINSPWMAAGPLPGERRSA